MSEQKKEKKKNQQNLGYLKPSSQLKPPSKMCKKTEPLSPLIDVNFLKKKTKKRQNIVVNI